jgi:hypothetical protein
VEGGGACAARIVWHGRAYAGVSLRRTPELGGRLGKGVVPPCNDTVHSTGGAQRVALYRIAGVDPGGALAVDFGPILVFVPETPDGAPGRLPPTLEHLRAP